MKITLANTHIVEDGKFYKLRVYMPDGSRNYVEAKFMTIPEAVLARELVDGCIIDKSHLSYIREGSYYRLILYIGVNNDETNVRFHSRKLNLNDLVFETNQLQYED